MAKRKIAERIDGELTVEASTPCAKIADVRRDLDATLEGPAPRGIEEAQAAVYFACSEAIQNVATHAGRAAQIERGSYQSRGTLAVRIAGPESSNGCAAASGVDCCRSGSQDG